MSKRGKILWQPSPEQAERAEMTRFETFLEAKTGLHFDNYMGLWEWSVTELEQFWSVLWEFADIRASAPYETVLETRKMPGAAWFTGARTNYADQIFRHVEGQPNKAAIISHSETFGRRELSYGALYAQVSSLAARLRALGVGEGDRVVAILPNSHESVVAFLATISVGAVWSLCAPDMGHVAVIDRFLQIAPKVLITQDNYVHAGKQIDRAALIEEVAAALPSVTSRIVVPTPGQKVTIDGALLWPDLVGDEVELTTAQLPFEAPLWVVYSSGTTGNPKPIVHGHIGTLVEVFKQAIHQDLIPTDRFMWLTSSGWIMWNAQMMALMRGATLVIYDGAPNYPDFSTVWRLVADEGITQFGAGAAFFASCLKAGIRPDEMFDLSRLRALGPPARRCQRMRLNGYMTR